jgi:hypothetical protein
MPSEQLEPWQEGFQRGVEELLQALDAQEHRTELGKKSFDFAFLGINLTIATLFAEKNWRSLQWLFKALEPALDKLIEIERTKIYDA